ncbi:SCL-interrupting locus protein homolog isoform X3 [Simochromis diagramma]|uniref:SCL-interrupting locus protein homolog isoform X3 n=1 Tax=Simochromis diagramma TaxID=43689 RepID=UPI001A7EB7CF|nr:SCL-interrupting locus protein homolog isoform X3 [Simochromis diagramma]
MNYPRSLQGLPCEMFQETARARNSVNPRTPLSFPKSRSALWDSSPMGEKLRLHLSSHSRKPQLVLLEKTLRLAHRHARCSNKPRLHCFLLGTVSVDSDEEGITITLDRFDPGRDQAGASGQVPSAPLPGDVLVPCLFSSQTETVVQSEAELHHCFKVLQQFVSSRQTLDLSQLLKVKGHVACCEQSDAATFTLSWSIISPSVSVEVEPVRSVPIIPTALFRSLTNVSRPLGRDSSRQRGFLTMDQTRKLLLLLESDPKASSLPLVGLWLSGVTHIYNPQVWAWCLRFMFSSTLQDRVLSDGGFFLLVVFGCARRAPQFFRCRGSGPQLDCQLLTASHTATLYQAVQVDGKTLQVELTSEDHSRKLEVFREAQISFSRAPPPSAALSVTDQDSGVEDDDLSPRPSPSPHTPAHQARRVEPSVPELSLLIDSSFTCTQPNPAFACKPPAHPRGNSSSAPRTPPYLQSTPNPNSNPQQPCNCCSNHPYNCTAIIASPGLPPAASPVSYHNDPSPSSLIHAPPPPPPPSNHPSLSVPPAPTTRSVPPSFTCPAPSPSHQHVSPPHSSSHPAPLNPDVSTPLSTHHYSPPCTLVRPPTPSFPCRPPASFPHSYAAADPVPSPWLSQPSCMNQCCYQAGRVVPPDTYQLLLHQEHQLRLLQAQVQILLEAQKKLQSSNQSPGDIHTPMSVASIAVETGASLFWGSPAQSTSHQEEQVHPPSSTGPLSTPKSPPSSSSSSPSNSSSSLIRPAGSADSDRGHSAPCSPPGVHSSPVLGESLSMYKPTEEQHTFYHNLMTQLTSRLQESPSKQEVEDESRRTRSLSAVSDCSQSFQSMSSSSSSKKQQQQSPVEDPVVSATLRQLQQLGVHVDEDVLTESGKNHQKAVETASTLASINPAAVLSRLSVSEPTASALCPGGSVDLSLEANAIALHYLSDSQLSRLSLGGHIPHSSFTPSSTSDSLPSPSNMSLATRKYMRKYGLIEEEDGEDEVEQKEVGVQETSDREPLTEAVNVRFLPQSQLIQDLRPKMQLLANHTEPHTSDKKNHSNRQPSFVRANLRQTEGSLGNILDLSRLRQLPKLF